MRHLQHVTKRLRSFGDLSAWLLIAPALAALWWIDAPTAKSLVEWSLFGIVMAGVAVIISRLVFPDLHLREYLEAARYPDGTANAIVAAALIVFVAIVFFTLVYWAKP